MSENEVDKKRVVIGPQEGPQTDFLANESDICLYGGAAGGGKSYAILIDPLRHINVPNFNCTIFRKTSPQIRNAGGLWDTSVELYNDLNCKPTESRLLWKFDCNGIEGKSEVRFGHLEYEQDKYNYDGSQICMIGYDELQHFSETQFFYMLSRNRSTCGVTPYVRATCNPDADSWLRKFIDWYIGKDGLPILERSGVERYFMRVDGMVKWGNSKSELLKANDEFVKEYKEIQSKYKKAVRNISDIGTINSIKVKYVKKADKAKEMAMSGIKSFTFIASNVTDNKILLTTNPGYLANLKSLPLVERERLLKGNWNIRLESGKFFNKDWFDIVNADEIPSVDMGESDVKEVRYWDFAATAPSGRNKDPDYTAGIKMRKIGSNYYIISVIRERLNPAELEKLFLETSMSDKQVADDLGIEYMVRWEEEGGASGKNETYRLKTLLAGFNSNGVPTAGKGKELRAKPLAVQAEIGNVKLMKAEWNDILLGELHMFGDIGIKNSHDDQVDACSGAFNQLCSIYIHPTIHGEETKEYIPEEERALKRLEHYKSIEEDFLNGDDF